MAKILVVDDHRPNRQYLITLLGYRGHDLLEASDGVEALAMAKAQRPHLVIADILMPTMDGYEFVQRLRTDKSIASTPVIFYTANYHEREAHSLAEACGVRHILTKPAEPETVLQTVDAALGLAVVPTTRAQEEFNREHLRVLTNKLAEKTNELRSTNERLSALVELGLQLGCEHDVHRLLEKFCQAARQIIGARYAVTAIVGGNHGRWRQWLTSGMEAELATRLTPPDPERGEVATLLRELRCLRMSNPSGDPTALGFPAGYPPVHAWLGAPIVSPGRCYGWLGLLDKVGAEEFSSEDERVAGILAAQVGRVYENGSLYGNLLHHTSLLDEEIAERKLAVKALRASEERFRLLLESAPDAMVIVNAKGEIELVNSETEKLFGYPKKELIGRPEEILIPERFRPQHFGDRGRYLRNPNGLPSGSRLELFGLRKDGTEFPVEISLSPLQSGDEILISSSIRDISERRRLEDQVRRAQLRLQHVVVSNPALLYTLAVEGEKFRGTWIGDNVKEMLGYDLEEALRPDWWSDNIHPEDFDQVMSAHGKDFFQTGRLVLEYRFRAANGKYLWIRDEKRLLRNDAGAAVEVVGSWSNITERRQLEEQFRQSQKMEAIGRLAGGVAHDFNNLLTVINGYSELSLAGLHEGDPLRQLLEQISEAGKRAAGLTRQLLAFSRKQVLIPVVLNLNELLGEMEKMLSRLIGEDIDLVVSPQDDLWPIKVDTGQMEQVVMNLVVNARDAMPQGGKLTIETANIKLEESYAGTHPGSHAGPHIRLAVSDTGCGMDRATQTRIFEPFFTTKGPEKGTGLGLATVYGIVKQSGGHIEVYSEPGVGTTFKIYLPREPDAVARSISHAGLRMKPTGTETVLLTEDEESVRALARMILQRQGYKVLEARNGGEALLCCEQHSGPIHLLITDVIMPGLSGQSLVDRLRKIRPEMKVLCISGYTDDAIVRHGILEGNIPFLPKPFSPDALALKVREILDAGG